MINKDKLYTIFNPDKYTYLSSDNDRIILYYKNKNINLSILNDKHFNYLKTKHSLRKNLLVRKNCLIIKNKTIIIIFNLYYINVLLRQKTINTILND